MKKLLCVLFGAIVLALSDASATSTINSTNQYAWGANIGWTNWRPDPDATNTTGVVIGEFICSGYVYGANVGWINMGNGLPVNHIQYQNNSATDFGVNYGIDPMQPNYGILRGLAYGANIGWINFEATGNPRIRFTDGALEGYAYSANCGWINLGDMSEHNLVTDHIAMGVDTDGNGIADAWEYQYFGHLLGAAASQDPDGDGMSNLQEYQAGTDPTVPGDRLRIIAVAKATPTTTSITWKSTTGRLYTIETSLGLASWATDTTFSYPIAPDQGTQTTRTVNVTNPPKQFYRVKAIRPLFP